MPRTLNNRPTPARIPADHGWDNSDLSNNFARLARRQDQQFEHMPYILGSKTVSTGTGSATAETVLHRITFRAGMMGVTGAIRIHLGGVVAGTANTRRVRLRFGDGTFGAGDPVVAEQEAVGGIIFTDYGVTVIIANQNNAAVQVAITQGNVQLGGGSAASFLEAVALTVDTSVTPTGNDTASALAITVTGETVNAADEVTNHYLIAELLPIIP